MKIIAFDLGTTCGIAIGDSGDDGPACFTERMGEPGSSHGALLTQMQRTALRLIKEHSPELIVMEAPIATGPAGGQERAQLAFGYRAAVLIAAFAKNIRPAQYDVSTVRKHFVGRGNLKSAAAKTAVFQRCRQLRWMVENTDQSDAAAVWDYARCRMTRRSTPPPSGLFDVR